MKLRKILSSLCAAALLLSALPAALGADAGVYTDAAHIQHWEAVAALSKLEVIGGKDDGSFDPAGVLTRAEAAKLIAFTMSAGKDPITGDWHPITATGAGAPSFTDIQGHWAENYIEYCVDMGILSGTGDGSFAPNDPLTGTAWLKMALCALGYDSSAYNLVGAKWVIRVDELARSTDPSLYQELSGVDINAPISRDNAAQILYNALQATPKVVAPVTGLDGSVSWEFKEAARSDGTPSTLLWERFQLEEVGQLPAQPEKK